MQALGTLRLCLSPAPNINTRLPACLCLLPLVPLLLSSFLPPLDQTQSLGSQGSSHGGRLWAKWCKEQCKLCTMTLLIT